jgi:hypothetical protein
MYLLVLAALAAGSGRSLICTDAAGLEAAMFAAAAACLVAAILVIVLVPARRG